MFSISTYLFGGEVLSNYLADRLSTATRAFERAELEDLTPEKVQEVVDRHSYDLPTLRRAEATLEPRASNDGIIAVLTVPVEGNVRVLEFKLGYGMGRSERVQLTDHLNFNDDPTAAGAVGAFTATHRFSADDGPQAVKSWAGDLADWVEETLRQMRPVIDAHNAALQAQVPSAADRRRATLQAADDWKGQLGTGI